MSSRNAKPGRGGGPKTQTGRERSSQNARRHGLSLNIANLEEYSAEREELAHLISGSVADEAVESVAQQIAEAEIDLRRVQRAREELFEELTATAGVTTLENSTKPTRQELQLIEKIKILKDRKRPLKNQDEILTRLREALNKLRSVSGTSQRAGEKLSPLDKLIRIERYERRALSRRRKAINKFLEVSSAYED